MRGARAVCLSERATSPALLLFFRHQCFLYVAPTLGGYVIPLVFHTFRPESVKYNLLCIRFHMFDFPVSVARVDDGLLEIRVETMGKKC